MNRQPYIGLRAFSREEQALFFGREHHSSELIDRLNQQHFLAVVGDSGCGKSSLIKAGLIPSLQAGFLTEAGSHWRIAETRPGNQPFANLAKALCDNNALGEDYQTALLQNQFLNRSPFSLHELLSIKPLANQAKLLIVCDQFEELFRYAKQANTEEAAAFAALLLASANPYPLANGETSTSIYVIVTMRSDYLGQCAQFSGLAEAINQGLYLTPRLNRQQLRSAIERPALVCQGKIEPALLVRLLTEIANDADQLPLLQHLLMRLWDKAAAVAESETQRITLADYLDKSIQTLKNALSTHADEAFNELNAAQKLLAQQIFCRLTGAETGKTDTRNPTKISELADLTEQNVAQLTEILKPFRQTGRCFLLPSAEIVLTKDTVIDIAHESLIRNWTRLEQWTQVEAENAKTYQRLEDRALEWQKGKADFLQSPELEIFTQWWQENQSTAVWAQRYGQHFDIAQAYLGASELTHRRMEKAKTRQRRFAFLILASFSMFALGLAAWAYTERHHAQLTEKQRSKDLFQSRLTHASLLAKMEDYLGAKQTLNETDALDTEATQPMLHARNLLRSFAHIMGGESDPTFDGKGAGYPLMTTAISPDGKLLAAGGEHGTVVIFDAVTGKLLQRLEGHATEGAAHDNAVMSIAFTPQGDTLISGGLDKKIIFWQQQGQRFKQQRVLNAPDKVYAIAISSDGKLLASGGDDKNISLWDVSSGKLLKTLEKHSNMISKLAFSANGDLLASSAFYDNVALIWEVKTGKLLQPLQGHGGYVNSVAFSADSNTVATASEDKTVKLWNVANGQLLRTLVGHANNVFDVQFIGNGDTLLSAGFDRTIRLWDTQSGVTLRILQGHEAGVTQAALYGDALFTASNDGTVRRWQLSLPYQQRVTLPSEPASNAISPDLQQLALGFANGSLQLYDIATGQWLWKKENVHNKDINRLTFNNAGNLLASASVDKIAKVWQLKSPATLQELQIFKGHTNVVHAVSFSPDSQTLATASYDGQIGLFPLNSQEKPRFIENSHEGRVASVTFSKDGKQLLSTGNEDRLSKLWNIQTNPATSQTLVQANDKLLWSSWSPDNQWLAAVGRSLAVDVYNTASRSLKYHLTGHENAVYKAIFSPDSQQLATVAGDATAKFWDIEQGKQLFSVHLPVESANPVPFWDFDFRCQAANCLMAVPLTRKVLQLYQFSYEGKPPLDPLTEKHALLPLWHSYLDAVQIHLKQQALQPAAQALRETAQIASHYPAQLVHDAEYAALKKRGDCQQQKLQQLLKNENQPLSVDCEIAVNKLTSAKEFDRFAVTLYKQKRYAEAQAIFAKALAKFPEDFYLLSNDTELALVQGDKPRMQKRLSILQTLYNKKDGIYTDLYPAIMQFLLYLSDDKQTAASVLKVIAQTDKAVNYSYWDFSDIQPFLEKQNPAKQKIAKLLIDFFKKRINLKQLEHDLTIQ